MNTEYIFLKEAPLPTHCPECYTVDGLQLSFYQKRIVSKLFHRVTEGIEAQLECKICETRIYPGRWTRNIEHMSTYHQKTIVPKKSKLELTRLSQMLIGGVGLTLVFAVIYGLSS